MRIDIVSVAPEILKGTLYNFLIKRAIYKGIMEIYIHDLRDYGLGICKKVDDYPYGGGSGMVIRIEPVYRCFHKLFSERNYDEKIFMTPDGNIFSQKDAKELTYKKNILILCGRYKGIDQRIRDHLISKEISIGPYILSGGELAAAVVVDAITRLLPGVLNNPDSMMTDSLQRGSIYTRPVIYKGLSVPKILLSGHHQKIKEWIRKQSNP
ncbi:MAG: tRNA (guanosine(37)-N1)-methyltransferase TrmD [Flavobacteriales bacterium]|jgi:tRNA (guanine37-N1)-methyltransferase|uniref:tRNA (guanosine(37)-N1)-methyltransferase TrmD n=1 Tax=Blattabacterium sp. (Mastotermes darwiniensis) TaxID=39768 RepID=UPI000231DF87|nr:tRNA (guanosine(37)-N1)-methyltransferase TrmD [Blattabacterium sp. (Mastotermes darwiniensis)]AER40415.1 tRNA (guanine-N-(1)-)-methyltransferase [Blattabacterium sp. (Mastotermes darwiniensis) str. MADAR]MDR1804862.1 tRNA (guanosine(37)-N1)-methyltransferase TrmD [Flavobacteriales bacterium]